MSHTRRQCIDCGTPCKPTAYRCNSCASTERAQFNKLLGHGPSLAGLAKAREKQKQEARQRLADIDADRRLGIDADRIAADQDRTRTALERFCQRHGRPDLAEFFHAIRPATDRRTGTCATCGGTCQRHAARCVSCWTRWVRGDAA